MSFDLEAIGRLTAEHRYDVTKAALQAYADATDDVPGGPVFAVVPAAEVIALASRSVASDEVRTRVVHYEQDFRPPPAARAGDDGRGAGRAGRVARAPERNVARHSRGDEGRAAARP